MSATEHATETVAWHALSAAEVATRLATDPERGLDAGEVERRRAAVRTQRAGDGAAAERLGRGSRAAVEPDEHHAVDRLGGQLRDRSGSDGRLRAWSRVVQRHHGLEPGAEGPGKRRGALAAPGPSRPCPAIGERRGDRLPGARAWRRRVARGGRSGSGRWTTHLRGDGRGAGSGPHRRERAGAQGHEPDRR